jgi:hypothetical protein
MHTIFVKSDVSSIISCNHIYTSAKFLCFQWDSQDNIFNVQNWQFCRDNSFVGAIEVWDHGRQEVPNDDLSGQGMIRFICKSSLNGARGKELYIGEPSNVGCASSNTKHLTRQFSYECPNVAQGIYLGHVYSYSKLKIKNWMQLMLGDCSRSWDLKTTCKWSILWDFAKINFDDLSIEKGKNSF